ncbi:MAG: ketoacyl-ACP synthase III [Bacteroidetes bacterium]|nr:ketoacyl-ACP synthase III [Bacteroidota bacterium]
MGISIKAISYYLPENVLTNDDLSKQFPEWTIERITNKLGISKRHICSENETVSDMSVNASLKLFEEYNVSKNEIDYIILCTQSPDYYLPTTACVVQHRLGLKQNIGAIDFNLGCSGYIYGLGLSKALIQSNQANNVLLITSEAYSKHIKFDDKSNRSIFGDAATASLISNGDGKIEDFDYGTDGGGSNNLIVKNGGLKFKKNNTEDDYLFMNGAKIFSFTLEKVPLVVKNILDKSKLSIEDIDLFIFHQANKFMLENLRKKLKISENKFYYFIENVGNTVSSTIPLALNDAYKNNRIKKNDKVMLVGFGVGYSWGGCIIYY